jgi:hypothetical protein
MLYHRTRYNDHRRAKSIIDSIDFAARRQVWQRMIQRIIRPMLIAMKMGQKSAALLLRSFGYAKLRGATRSSAAPSNHHYPGKGR